MADSNPRPSSKSATEATPLLVTTARGSAVGPGAPPLAAPVPAPSPEDTPKARTQWTTVNLLLLVNLIASSSGGFVTIPLARLVEDVICQDYYRRTGSLADSGIDESQCKVEAIQSTLMTTLAVQAASLAVVGFLSAYPWSLLADRFGRKRVLSLSLVGIGLGASWTAIVLSFPAVFPVRLIWLEALGALIGGGNPVAVGLLLTMFTDASIEEERAVIFLRQNLVTVCGNLVSPTLSAFVISLAGPWPSYFIGFGLISISAVLVFFVPETLKANYNDDETATGPDDGQKDSLWQRVQASFSMLASPSLILLLLTCLATLPFMACTTSFMVVFISKRYGIKLFQGGYVQTAYGLATVLTALAILPAVSRYLTSPSAPSWLRQPSEKQRDLEIGRWSAGLAILAAVVLGLAPSLVGFALGLALLALASGFTSMTKSIMSLYVDPVHRSRLFGVVGMIEILGAVYAAPVLAALYSLGMRLGGAWIGLPYFGLALLMTVVTTLLVLVKVPRAARDDEVAGGEREHQD